MVYSGCFIPSDFSQQFKSFNFNDSKKVKEAQREAMYSKLVKLAEEGKVGFVVETLSADKINKMMLAR